MFHSYILLLFHTKSIHYPLFKPLSFIELFSLFFYFGRKTCQGEVLFEMFWSKDLSRKGIVWDVKRYIWVIHIVWNYLFGCHFWGFADCIFRVTFYRFFASCASIFTLGDPSNFHLICCKLGQINISTLFISSEFLFSL